MTKPKIGLLPLYLELYDKGMPGLRNRMEGFYNTIARELECRGLEVSTVPVCRLAGEFRSAIKSIEDSGASCIVTLHLAYSPSLESAQALASTDLPIIVLDTTPAFDFGPGQVPEEIMFNHGIHGVQDMCNLLIRNGKRFGIEAGHWRESDVLDRVTSRARASRVAGRLQNSRIGLIGEPFAGMGDFAVPPETLKDSLGIETVRCNMAKLRLLAPGPSEPCVNKELAEDKGRFLLHNISRESHIRSIRAGIAVRRWMDKEALDGFTVNFLAIDSAFGLPTVPFLEAGKAMSRGQGYAGEGDVLTSALTGALAGTYRETTFTEMFCPDWKNNAIFLSHMGEMNPDIASEKAELKELPFPWTNVKKPVAAVGRFKAGDAVLVNLAPGPDGCFSLIVSAVEMLEATGEDYMSGSIHGWFRPPVPVSNFLEAYSRAGGTHHLVLVYKAQVQDILHFGSIMGWSVINLSTR